MNNLASSSKILVDKDISIELPLTRELLEQLVTDIFLDVCDGNIQQVLSYGDQFTSARFMSNVFEDIFIFIHQFGDSQLEPDEINIIARRIEDVVKFYFVTSSEGNEPESQLLKKSILGIISIICPDYEYSREDLYEG